MLEVSVLETGPTIWMKEQSRKSGKGSEKLFEKVEKLLDKEKVADMKE